MLVIGRRRDRMAKDRFIARRFVTLYKTIDLGLEDHELYARISRNELWSCEEKCNPLRG